MLEIYPWQHQEWQQLLDMQQQQRLPHALLLSGTEGIGLKQFARVFAMQMLCLAKNGKNAACGHCQSCQLYQAGSHPDFKILEPEETGKQVKIDQIRNLINYVSLKSFAGEHKIAIIDPADAMNRSTANALLKTLEEPPEQSMLLLLSHHPTRLPITIRSRCQQVKFKTATNEIATAWLESTMPEQSIDNAGLLLGLAQGGPLRAAAMFESNQLEQRAALLKDLRQISDQTFNVIEIAANWQQFGCENVLMTLQRLIHDMIKLKLLNDQATLLNLDIKEDLQDIVKTLDLVSLIKNFDFIQKKYQEAVGSMNFNALSLLEEVIISWSNSDMA